MAAGLKSWVIRFGFQGSTCALLALTFLATTHAIWHPDPPNTRCAFCYASKLPHVPRTFATCCANPSPMFERVESAKPVFVASRELRSECGRAPPA